MMLNDRSATKQKVSPGGGFEQSIQGEIALTGAGGQRKLFLQTGTNQVVVRHD